MHANKFSGSSSLPVLLVPIVFSMMTTALSGQNRIEVLSSNLHLKPVGAFTGDAALYVYERKGEAVLHVTFDFYVGSTMGTNDLGKKLATFPSQELAIWVLCEQGRTLQLQEKWPPPGRIPGGYGKSGTGGGQINYRFYDPGTNAPSAVVVKLYDEYRVFPLDKSISPQNPVTPRQEKPAKTVPD